jgi:hypothetical protein
LKWQPKRCFNADGKYVLMLLSVVMHEHQFKRKRKYCKFHFDNEAYTKPKNVWPLHFKLEVFIWRHVVYVPKSSTTFRGILISVIFRPRDMQEYYMLFGSSQGIHVHIPCLFSISSEPISNTRMFIYFVYCMVGHLLQGSIMQHPLYTHRLHPSMT